MTFQNAIANENASMVTIHFYSGGHHETSIPVEEVRQDIENIKTLVVLSPCGCIRKIEPCGQHK